MRKALEQVIELPEGVQISLVGSQLILKGKEGSVERQFPRSIFFENKESKLRIYHAQATKKEKKLINTTAAHIRNMIKGVVEPFKYTLKVCNVHFPMTVSVVGENVIIKNFLGEVKERKASILPGIKVKIDKDIISVSGCDKDKTGQTAANIETATKIRNRDRRIFQDGIFITEKAGVEI